MSTNAPENQREELEAQVTALLLGELPREKVVQLQDAIASDDDLRQLHQRLAQTLHLVQEATSTPTQPTHASPVTLRLSEVRRQELLRRFRTVLPGAFGTKARPDRPWVIPMAIAAGLVALLGFVALWPGAMESAQPTKTAAYSRREPASKVAPEAAPFLAKQLTDPGTTVVASKPTVQKRESNEFLGRYAMLAPAPQQPTQQFEADGKALAAFGPAAVSRGLNTWSVQTGRQEAEAVPGSLPPSTNIFAFNFDGVAEKETLANDMQDLLGRPANRPRAIAGTSSGNTIVAPGRRDPLIPGMPESRPSAPSESKAKVPVLGDLPIAGGAFQLAVGQSNDPKSSLAGGLAGGGFGGAGFADANQGQNLGVEGATGAFENDGFLDLFVKKQQPEVAFFAQAATSEAAKGQALPGLGLPEGGLKLYHNNGLFKSKAAEPVEPSLEVVRQKLAKLQEDKETRRVIPLNEAPQTVQMDRNRIAGKDDAPIAGLNSAVPSPAPLPEIQTTENPFSTFSLNVSDVSFKLAAASLEKGQMPQAGTIRAEEFINAFDYRDPDPAEGVPIAFTWEQARSPFAQNRDLLRLSLRTAAQGRAAGRPLNVVLLLDRSGSMERADRVRIMQEALRVLAEQLQPQDKLSVITFARTARLWADGVSGSDAKQVLELVGSVTPEGGTNLEEALRLAYEIVRKHYLQGGINRVVLFTDGAANLGEVNPEVLRPTVEAERKKGIALDCFGVGWEGFNDHVLEVLSSHADGRYGFLNTPEEAASGFATQLAGALRVAAADVKVQVEFNPNRVAVYRQIGYHTHQLTKEQFLDNTVDAAELGAAETGTALYVMQVNANGQGDLATLRVRYKTPETGDVHEQQWTMPYTGTSVAMEHASPAMRLATTAAAFAEWLNSSPYAAEATPDRLLGWMNGVPEIYAPDPRPNQLESMIRQARSLTGR
jgi:Mg-chelatase subunit ChlD